MCAVAYYALPVNQDLLFAVRPLISMGTLALLARHTLDRHALPAGVSSLKDVPWVIVVPLVALLLVVTVAAQLIAGYDIGQYHVVLHVANAVFVLVVAGCVAALLVRRPTSLDGLHLAFDAVFVLCSLALLAVCLAPRLAGLTVGVRMALPMFLWLACAVTCSARRVPGPLLFGVYGLVVVAPLGLRLFDHAGLLAALMSGGAATRVAMVAVFLLAVSCTLWVVRCRLRAAHATVEQADDAWQAQCRAAVRNAGLTVREVEVVCYTAKGYSAPATGEALGVSEHTVKNHLANAYRKLGVHSKQELIELVQNPR